MGDNYSYPVFGRHEFVTFQPGVAVPVLLILGVASVAGTFGNILILISVATRKSLQNVESIFIVNLACTDLYVTTIADAMSIVAKLEGPGFFDQVPGLCQTVGSLCTISCVTSLLTIATMSCNRYVFIVHNNYYRSIFRRRNSIIMCVCFYCVGIFLVLLNLADVGDHHFDHKSLECIWERMATVSYTVTFAVVMVWIPIFIVGASYLHMYLHVKAVRGRVHNALDTNPKTSRQAPNFKLAKTLFLIYCVFATCWVPYSILMAFDWVGTIRYEVFVFLVTVAHIHPSLNWLVYFYSNRKFHDAFIDILHLHKCFPEQPKYSTKDDGLTGKTAVSTVSATATALDC